ncbi:LuxR family two component transcriptional regulator [Kribbella rubisoli]|jgi:DNA-binding NarL/FixJ family response regulator|uniref:LuxR family two component transcriptional regulator n=1 Tax=Kribbella rubisoli TaxID=3075929 RepID=A0A4Q7WTX6_9ACTN|nr:response regulator transcription factor [Kribbella rubisoli]RZU13821.1 LuxR family two component transcriptional regulator [Kribbella rubisoli]
MTRLLIVDDEALVRAGLKMILESDDELEVVAEAEDGADAAAMVKEHRPDVVLMDIRMPRLDGLAATREVQALPDPPKIVVLTTFDLDDYVFRALQAGASGFLLKDTPPRELVQAIKVVAAGDAMLSPAVTRRLIGHFAGDPRTDRRRVARERISKLTEREREVLVEVGRGLQNADIGRKLFMSEATVKAHVSRALVKLDATNRVQVAILAYEAGLLDN